MIIDRVPLVLVGGKEVFIELPYPMIDEAWNHMIRLLEVMKEGYVQMSNQQVEKERNG